MNRCILAAAVGENLHFLCAGASSRFEIPRCFALAQDRLKSASFPERNLAPCSAVGMEWHDSIAVIQRLKTSIPLGTRPEAERRGVRFHDLCKIVCQVRAIDRCSQKVIFLEIEHIGMRDLRECTKQIA